MQRQTNALIQSETIIQHALTTRNDLYGTLLTAKAEREARGEGTEKQKAPLNNMMP